MRSMNRRFGESIILTATIMLATGSCGAPPAGEIHHPEPVDVHSDDPVAEKDFQDALNLFESGEWDDAERALLAFTEKFPDDPLVTRVTYLRGRVAIEKKDYKRAKELLESVVEAGEETPVHDHARLYLGVVDYYTWDFKGAVETLEGGGQVFKARR